MSSFTTPLIVEDQGYRHFVVREPFVYEVGALGSGRKVIIPVNFETDFASIPRGLWNILPPVGAGYDKAAVVHDYLYRGGFITSLAYDPVTQQEYELHEDVTRAQADAILKEAMDALGVGWWTRNMIYAGVRVGGHIPWTKGHTK